MRSRWYIRQSAGPTGCRDYPCISGPLTFAPEPALSSTPAPTPLPKALRRSQTCTIHSSSRISRRSKPGQCDSETLRELSSIFPCSRRGKHHLDARRNHRGEKAHVMPPNMIANCRVVLTTSIASSAACSHYGPTDQLVANTLERVQLRPVPNEA